MIPVKLPKQVLNLFPKWEYRCPNCGNYLEEQITAFCPNCETAFQEKKWRVAPRFLKSHKAMSEYAHKVLAPKLSREQRKLLFKYFTELFSDGFESGDFNAWTGTNGAVAVVGNPVHHGSYSAELDANYEKVYRDFSGVSQCNLRFYFYFASAPPASGVIEIAVLSRVNGGSTRGASVRIVNDGGTVKWQLVVTESDWSDHTYTADSPNPVANTWYCVELEHDKDSANGAKLYIDGSQILMSGTTLNVDTVSCSIRQQVISGTLIDLYFDCVIVADTYVGPETTQQTITKTWTTDSLFKKLDIQKAINVDTAFQKQNIPETFVIDSVFQKAFTIQKQIDALFKKFGIIKSFGLDTRFGALLTQTISRQLDVVFKKDVAVAFGLDAYFGSVESEAYVKNFGLDVMFAYKVRLPELWLDENGKIVLNISKPYAWVGT